jgi:protein ImuB
MYACVYAAGYDDQRRAAESAGTNAEHTSSLVPRDPCGSALTVVAQQFSPRYETRGRRVVIDVSGLERLLGGPKAIGDELRREAASRGLHAHVAVAATQTAAMVLAMSRPGVVVIASGGEAAAIAPVPIDLLTVFCRDRRDDDQRGDRGDHGENQNQLVQNSAISAISAFKHWGLRTLGDLAALPPAALSARLGPAGPAWQAIARGQDVRPLVPDVEDERFESALELEWPIEGLEPLSFVLTRLLEPLALSLDARDRGAAVLHVALRLVTAGHDKATHARRLELPSPMRDVKTLRTLALLDLEAHPPAAAVDGVAVTIEPTPGRIWQHTLFARPHPTPEQLSTLLARLGAAVGHDRVGAPATVDSYRPGAFTMKPFPTEHAEPDGQRRERRDHRENQLAQDSAISAISAFDSGSACSALRRCRQPVPARVAVDGAGRPVTVATDRRGFAGGAVVGATGPWKTSGEWWLGEGAGEAGRAGWDRDEWDVALSDGGAYRVFLDRATRRWFIDAILD